MSDNGAIQGVNIATLGNVKLGSPNDCFMDSDDKCAEQQLIFNHLFSSQKYKSSIFLCCSLANTKRNLKLCLMLCLNALTLIECLDPACHFVHSA